MNDTTRGVIQRRYDIVARRLATALTEIHEHESDIARLEADVKECRDELHELNEALGPTATIAVDLDNRTVTVPAVKTLTGWS